MKAFIMILFALGIGASMTHGQTNLRTFMPENDLHLEDYLYDSSNVSQEMFELVIETGRKLYEPMARANDETLTINGKWEDPTVNANCSRFFGVVTINMFGGLARRPEVSPAAFALVLCHELGHAYGDRPYINPFFRLSAEGQADYYGARTCLKDMLTTLSAELGAYETTPYTEDVCNGDEICMHQLFAGFGLGRLLAAMKESDAPDYETPDTTVVDRTVTSYPETIQCRLDTYHNGALELDRPRCWYAGD